MKQKKKNVIIPTITLLLCLSIMFISGYHLYDYYSQRINSEIDYENIRDLIDDDADDEDDSRKPVVRRDAIDVNKEDDPVDHPIKHTKYDKIYEQNPDFVGWINVPGTLIDYPVMQTKYDEQKYLHLNFNGYYAYEGVPFCNAISDLARPSDIITIYGHHMKYGTMFQALTYYEDKSFYQTHKTFYFDSIYRLGTYEVIGVVLTDTNDSSFKYWTVADCNSEEFYKYVNFIKNNSLYKIDAINNVEYGDMLVTLSTCEYHTSNGRLIVVGKMIETDDENLI